MRVPSSTGRRTLNGPMMAEDTRVVIIHSAITHNYRSLKSALDGGVASFVSTSDTEVTLRLHTICSAAALGAVDGMVGLAISSRPVGCTWGPEIALGSSQSSSPLPRLGSLRSTFERLRLAAC